MPSCTGERWTHAAAAAEQGTASKMRFASDISLLLPAMLTWQQPEGVLRLGTPNTKWPRDAREACARERPRVLRRTV